MIKIKYFLNPKTWPQNRTGGSINSNNDNNNTNNNLKTTKSLFVRTAMSFCFLGHKFALILRTVLLVARSNRLFQIVPSLCRSKIHHLGRIALQASGF